MRWLAAALAFVALVALVRVSTVEGVDHDGAISFLVATGHQAAFYREAPVHQWVDARQWQAFWRLDAATAAQPSTLARIGRELGETDIHPPLYFWALHLWLSLFGASPRVAALLGVPLLLVAVVLVERLARRSGAAPPVAAAVAALWGVSGATLTALVEPRPYVLVAVLAVALVLAMDAAARRPSAGRWALLVLVGAAGLLAQYQVAVLGLAAGAVVGFPLVRARHWHALASLVAAGGSALALATLAHPYLSTALARRGTGAEEAMAVAERIGLAAAAVVRMVLPAGVGGVVPSRLVLTAMAVAGLSLAGAFGVALVRRRAAPGVALATGAVAFALVAVLYVAGATPPHSMGPKYTMLVSPLLAAGLAGWLPRRLRRPAALLAVAAGVFALAAFVAPPRPADRRPSLPNGVPVVLDTVSGGLVPPLLWTLAPDTPVWAGRSLPPRLAQDQVTLVATGPAERRREAERRLARDGFRGGRSWRVEGGTARVWTRTVRESPRGL